ncbi:MAG: ornithine cyclodeaminase family protein [Coriobacteriaceae bacterium]|jgi:ornithine cyclodeaminase/alanine dehydrogenase|nr:ornithine cyclodeaminase family protein [Coriobacteriaceae bacterium]
MLRGGENAAIRVLSGADIASVLTPQQVIERVQEAYLWKAQGRTATFPLVFHEFTPGVADMDIKSGHLAPAGLFGLKLVSFFAPNAASGLPVLYGTILLADDATGAPLALMEGTHLTGLRTGAAAAIGALHLARPESERFLIVGAGHQCVFQVGAMACAFPQLKQVMICDPLDFGNAVKRAATLAQEAPGAIGMELPGHLEILAVRDLEEAVRTSDIITTATPAREPLIDDGWVQPGTHFSCVGSDMPGKQELDPRILARSRVFVDDLPQCLEVGEIELAVKAGFISAEDIIGEIGMIMPRCAEEKLAQESGTCGSAEGSAEGATPGDGAPVQGRTSPEDITVFDSTGIALQDLAAARAAFDAAEAAGLGVVAAL